MDEKAWNWVEANDAQEAAETFVEEYGIEDGAVVQVCRHGTYRVSVVVEHICTARKV